jgi:hypothetical protein
MWFLLLAGGAGVVQLAGVPLSRRLAVPPSPELLLAGWFLLATVVRLAVMRVRLAGFEKKARREQRRLDDKRGSPLGELGVGVGRGALQAVGGDVLGASLSLVAALLRGAAGTLRVKPTPQRERRQSAWRERLATVTCVLGVGFTCVVLAWWPLVGVTATRAAAPALRHAGLAPEPPLPLVGTPGPPAVTTPVRGPAPTPAQPLEPPPQLDQAAPPRKAPANAVPP